MFIQIPCICLYQFHFPLSSLMFMLELLQNHAISTPGWPVGSGIEINRYMESEWTFAIAVWFTPQSCYIFATCICDAYNLAVSLGPPSLGRKQKTPCSCFSGAALRRDRRNGRGGRGRVLFSFGSQWILIAPVPYPYPSVIVYLCVMLVLKVDLSNSHFQLSIMCRRPLSSFWLSVWLSHNINY